MLFSWFSIANFVLTFYYLAGSMNLVIKHGEALFIFFKYLIFCDLASLFIISMGNRPQGAKHLFITSMVILSICATYSLICGFVFAFKSLAMEQDPQNICRHRYLIALHLWPILFLITDVPGSLAHVYIIHTILFDTSRLYMYFTDFCLL